MMGPDKLVVSGLSEGDTHDLSSSATITFTSPNSFRFCKHYVYTCLYTYIGSSCWEVNRYSNPTCYFEAISTFIPLSTVCSQAGTKVTLLMEIHSNLATHAFQDAHIVVFEVGMSVLYSVVEDGDHDTSAGDPLFPCPLHVHVVMAISMLWGKGEGGSYLQT